MLFIHKSGSKGGGFVSALQVSEFWFDSRNRYPSVLKLQLHFSMLYVDVKD